MEISRNPPPETFLVASLVKLLLGVCANTIGIVLLFHSMPTTSHVSLSIHIYSIACLYVY